MRWKNVEFSIYDYKKGLTLPQNVTPDLAYFCGIICGDGCINKYSKSKYYIFCGGNPNDEKEFYDVLVRPMIKKLFNLDVNMMYIPGGKGGNNGVYGFRFGSKGLYTFLVNVIKLPKGKKYDQLRIPDLFKNNGELVLSFIQGVLDADGGFALKKRYKEIPYYPVLSFSSKSERFTSEVWEILKSYGLKPINQYKMVQFDDRIIDGKTIRYIFEINGHAELYKWNKIIGIRQPKFIRKFNLWIQANKNNKKALNKIRAIAGEGFEFGDNVLV